MEGLTAVFPAHGDLEGVFGVDVEVVGVDAILIESPYGKV